MQTKLERFVVSSDLCSSSGNDGTVILDTSSGVLYSLIGMASRVWLKISSSPDGLSVTNLTVALQPDFPGIPTEQFSAEISGLLDNLVHKGLLLIATDRTHRIVHHRWIQRVIRTTMNILSRFDLIAIAAFLQLLTVDLMIRCGGFRNLHCLLKKWPIASPKSVKAKGVDRVCESVNRAGKVYFKQVFCLQRSVVLICLLRSCGISAAMVIACRKVPFKAHAWVEVDGKVVSDNPKVQIFYNEVLKRYSDT